MMPYFINEKETKELYEEFIERNKIQPKNKTQDFKEFLDFLGVDFYDWVRENLRYYFFQHKDCL